MCSVIIARNMDDKWPVMLAANRDEMIDRPWLPPARHWSDREEVIGGLDELGGGTWLGLNDSGVVATILNRKHTLGPADGKRSRGELVLEALDHPDANAAAEALSELNGEAYRPFNLLIADNRDAYIVTGLDQPVVRIAPVPEGLSMITHADRNDTDSSRIGHYLPLFEGAPLPDPSADDWSAWSNLLADRRVGGVADDPRAAMNIGTDIGFGTSSSVLLALPAMDQLDVLPVFRFSPGRPDEVEFSAVGDLRSAKDAALQQVIASE
ncbi:MAG: NRDE family protein [Alphaproteobacteria bacterium]|nr:NRDE family protein [Alphaproteobacteria bacterium SS10]